MTRRRPRGFVGLHRDLAGRTYFEVVIAKTARAAMRKLERNDGEWIVLSEDQFRELVEESGRYVDMGRPSPMIPLPNI